MQANALSRTHLHGRHNLYPSKPLLPIIRTNQPTLGRRAFAASRIGPPEPNIVRREERRRVHDYHSVPAAEYLEWLELLKGGEGERGVGE